MFAAPSRADAPTDAKITSLAFSVEWLDTETKTVSCPSGERLVGGGVLQTGSANRIWTHASGPLNAAGDVDGTVDGTVPHKWRVVSEDAAPSGEEADSKVMAVCSAQANVKIEASNLVTVPNAFGDHNVDETQAQCPGTRRAIGGGVMPIGGADDVFVVSSGPLDDDGSTLGTSDGDVPTQWNGAVESFSSVLRKFKVFAICARGSHATVQATDVNLLPRGSEGDFAECPDGRIAVGGGFVQSGSADGPVLEASGPIDETGSVSSTRTGDVPRAWYAAAFDDSDVGRVGRVFAVCEPK
jgi:hypothetical protein